MGRDKHENEDLIKYGFHEDIWFHVDNLSSAHVYLRLPKGCTMDDIEPDTLEDCAQLVKDNSIKGPSHAHTSHAGLLFMLLFSSYLIYLIRLIRCSCPRTHVHVHVHVFMFMFMYSCMHVHLIICSNAGCKMDSVDVVYTPWGNLRKTKDMEIGQASNRHISAIPRGSSRHLRIFTQRNVCDPLN